MNNIILTGELRAGKSSVVRNILTVLSIDFLGIFCEPVFHDQKQIGCGLRKVGVEDLDIFAHVDWHENRFGNYGCDSGPFQRAADYITASLEKNPPLFVVDEVGLVEKSVEDYLACLLELLNSSVPSFVVIQNRADYFWELLKERHDVTIFRIVENNHIIIQDEILRLLKEITNTDCGVDIKSRSRD